MEITTYNKGVADMALMQSSGRNKPKCEKEQPSIFSPNADGEPTKKAANGQISWSGDLTIRVNDTTLKIERFAEIGKAMSVTTHKLLNLAILLWTQQKNTIVTIPLKDYLTVCGYRTETMFPQVNEFMTPIECRKIRIKATNARKDFKRMVQKDLELLVRALLTCKGAKGHVEMHLLAAAGFQGKGNDIYLYMELSKSFISFLNVQRVSMLPLALFAIDARKPNAYRLGQVMCFHYNNDNNQMNGTADRLKVSTLLSYTDFPTIAEVRTHTAHKSWQTRIKEPLEKALNELIACSVLEEWHYSYKKNALEDALSDVLPNNVFLTGFEPWAEALIYFTLKDAPDHKERLAEKKNHPRKKGT